VAGNLLLSKGISDQRRAFHYYPIPSYPTLIAEHDLVLVEVHDDPSVSTYFLTRKAPR
jgi:hypothetical protein